MALAGTLPGGRRRWRLARQESASGEGAAGARHQGVGADQDDARDTVDGSTIDTSSTTWTGTTNGTDNTFVFKIVVDCKEDNFGDCGGYVP